MKRQSIIMLASLLILFSSLFFLGCGTTSSGGGGGQVSGTWQALSDVPEAVYEGGSLSWGGGNYLYAFVGGSSESFYRYDISADTWTAMASAPAYTGDGACLAYHNGVIFASRGASPSNKNFWKYHIATNTWEVMTVDFLSDTYKGTLATVSDEVYVMAEFTPTFYKYDIAGNTFEVLSASPYSPYHGCSMAWDWDDTVYMRNGNGQPYFWKYSISLEAHNTSLSSYSDSVRRTGNALVYTGGNYVYSLRGNGTLIFEAYNIALNAWEALTDTPDTIIYGGSLTWAGGEYLYVIRGNNSTDFWRYKL